jgi:tellurite resistance protein
MAIVDLLPSGPIANAEHVDAFLELTYLMIAADGKITDEERLAFGQITGRLRGMPADVEAFERELGTKGGDPKERIRTLGPTLPNELKESAFKVAIAIALSDNDASKEEEALMHVYFEALGLDPARAEALAKEARAH